MQQLIGWPVTLQYTVKKSFTLLSTYINSYIISLDKKTFFKMLYILIILLMIRICTLTCIEYVKKMLFVCKPLAILNHKMYDFLENGMESF